MSAEGDAVLWSPNQARIDAALVSEFRLQVNRSLNTGLDDYDDLYRWSVAESPSFWRALWDFAEVLGDGPGDTTLVDGDRMPGACWFPEARINFAENLLRGPD